MRGGVIQVQRVNWGEDGWLGVKGSPSRLLDMNALRATSEGMVIGMMTGRRGRRFIRGRGPAGRRGDLTGGARGSHAISKGMARSGDVALRTSVATAMELIVAHPVAMETSPPVVYVRVQERLIVLGQGQIW